MIVGPSGAGKGAIVAGLLESVPRLWLSRSWTTRPRRPAERADAYVFVDRAGFEAQRDSGGFLEWDEHFGHLYGTPRSPGPDGLDVVLEIDVMGAAQVRLQRPDSVVLLVRPPSRAELENRLRQRGESDLSIAERLSRADEEEALGADLADHVVVNDDLSRAVAEVAGIVEAHRLRRSRHPGREDEDG